MTALDRPIGVIDSGFGGLTVLRSLVEQLPNEDFVYLGDTARALVLRLPRARTSCGHIAADR